jgi:hypothetical protein
MTLTELMKMNSDVIVAHAHDAISRSQLNGYKKAGEEEVNKRLSRLFQLTLNCVQDKNLTPMISYSETIGRERFDAGFDLSEVQTAFNVLEEAIWLKILKELPPEQFAQALGLISTVLGAGKDNLARTYVSLASKTKAPSLNLQAICKGTEGI